MSHLTPLLQLLTATLYEYLFLCLGYGGSSLGKVLGGRQQKTASKFRECYLLGLHSFLLLQIYNIRQSQPIFQNACPTIVFLRFIPTQQQIAITVMSKESHQKQKQQPRYSIFRNPLFNQPATISYQKVPFHISYSGNYEYECVIDHTRDSISTRKTLLNRSAPKRSQSTGAKKRIFSQKKRNSVNYETMSPVQLILSKRQESFERQPRKHKIFGDYSTINSNQAFTNQKKTINNHQNRNTISYTNTFVLPQSKQQKPQRESSPQLKLKDSQRSKVAQSPKKQIEGQFTGLEPLNPIQFARLVFDFRLSQRIRNERNRPRQELKVQEPTAIKAQPKQVKNR